MKEERFNDLRREFLFCMASPMKELYDDHDNVVGVKDATANLSRTSEQRSQIGEDFIQLSGEDITALGFNAHGGQGCISVTANVAPRLCAEFQNACL